MLIRRGEAKTARESKMYTRSLFASSENEICVGPRRLIVESEPQWKYGLIPIYCGGDKDE